MAVTVVEAPDAIVTPADIAGDHESDDEAVAAMIAAVTEEIDAPDGWLGRSLGEQTLMMTLPDFGCGSIELLYRPVTEIVSVKYLDADLVEQTVSTDVYRRSGDHTLSLKPGQTWPVAVCGQPDAVRITYDAGYAEVPARVKQAIILTVQRLKSTVSESSDGFVETETVEGIGTTRYSLSDRAAATVQRAAESLLAGLRVWI